MIYFIQQGKKGPIKIGYSRNPIRRMKALQTATPYMLHLLGVTAGNKDKEETIQSMFSNCLIRNEWFQPTPKLLAFISKYTSLEIEKLISPKSSQHNRKSPNPKRSNKIMRFLRNFIEQNGYSPTVREIGHGTDIPHPSVVKYYLDLLVLDGALKKTNNKCRNIELA